MNGKRRGVIRWVTKNRRTGRYLRRGWARHQWVRDPAAATLDTRRGQWVADRGERRVKVLLTAHEDQP